MTPYTGAGVARFQAVRTTGRTLAATLVATLAGAAPAAAQAGVESNVAQVALLVRVPLEASIRSVGPAVPSGRGGSVTEESVVVRLRTNTGYRMMAVGLPSSRGSRIWVRSAGGEYQELVAGSSVTVARELRTAGELEREVSYRVESAGGDRVESLPVRYDVVVTPAI